MRFAKFTLKHYAGVEEKSLQFAPDKKLHFIWGANEAGKSRLLRSLGRFLFGMPRQNDADLFGGKKTLAMLEADIVLDDKVHRLARARQSKVISSDRQAEFPVSLKALLEGLDYAAFMRLHGLSQSALREGGLKILSDLSASDGGASPHAQSNLSLSGRLLVTGAGLGHVREKIDELRATADSIYLPRGRNQSLNEALRKRDDLSAQLKASQLTEHAVQEMKLNLDRLGKSVRDAEKELQAAETLQRGLFGLHQLRLDFAQALRVAQERIGAHQASIAQLSSATTSLGVRRDWLEGLSPVFLTSLQDLNRKLQSSQQAFEGAKIAQERAESDAQAMGLVSGDGHLNLANLPNLADLPDWEKTDISLGQAIKAREEAEQAARMCAGALGLEANSISVLKTVSFPDDKELRQGLSALVALQTEQAQVNKQVFSAEQKLRALSQDISMHVDAYPDLDQGGLMELRTERDKAFERLLVEVSALEKVADRGFAEARSRLTALLLSLQDQTKRADHMAQDLFSLAEENAKFVQRQKEHEQERRHLNTLQDQVNQIEERLRQERKTWGALWQGQSLTPIAASDYDAWYSKRNRFEQALNLLRQRQASEEKHKQEAQTQTKQLQALYEKSSLIMAKEQEGSRAEKTRVLAPHELVGQLKSWRAQAQKYKAQQEARERAQETLRQARFIRTQALESVQDLLIAADTKVGLYQNLTASTVKALVEQLEWVIGALAPFQNAERQACESLNKVRGLAQTLLEKDPEVEQFFAVKSVASSQDQVFYDQIKGLDPTDLNRLKVHQEALDEAQTHTSFCQEALLDLRREREQARNALESKLLNEDPLRQAHELGLLDEEIVALGRRFHLYRAAANALERGLISYEKQRGQDLLDKTTANFKVLTKGRYEALISAAPGEGPHWYLGDLEGNEIPERALSDGTRDQLFLALRLAILEGTALPFIADDLFINFDDERSEAAFRCMGETFAEGQIFYFSHHPHLYERACSALGANQVELIAL